MRFCGTSQRITGMPAIDMQTIGCDLAVTSLHCAIEEVISSNPMYGQNAIPPTVMPFAGSDQTVRALNRKEWIHWL